MNTSGHKHIACRRFCLGETGKLPKPAEVRERERERVREIISMWSLIPFAKYLMGREESPSFEDVFLLLLLFLLFFFLQPPFPSSPPPHLHIISSLSLASISPSIYSLLLPLCFALNFQSAAFFFPRSLLVELVPFLLSEH